MFKDKVTKCVLNGGTVTIDIEGKIRKTVLIQLDHICIYTHRAYRDRIISTTYLEFNEENLDFVEKLCDTAEVFYHHG